MILPYLTPEAIEVMAKLRRRGTVRNVRAKGAEQDEAELRAWQNNVKRQSRERKKPTFKEQR